MKDIYWECQACKKHNPVIQNLNNEGQITLESECSTKKCFNSMKNIFILTKNQKKKNGERVWVKAKN
ncbi:hypothetical protein [Williamsoniiplasma lucivorax]|uniref:Uncharacterized protein n=1 Tax=Williamsoniiplasma lucivorax TaxID=209274 RepID=A0A2S5RF78_9MOLU|nr:hypothetical protein [Williamsoniiplasma lucivorax]PPE05947.1 hypothetical protein ELUCI_v1c02380 [Williamsoniiplasma lucivorax]